MANIGKKSNDIKTALIATGGTGGHVFPALALAKKLQEKNIAKPIFVTDKRALSKFNFNNFATHKIFSGSPRGEILKQILETIKITIGVIQSLFLIIKHKPDIIIGFGGYPSFPPILAGRMLGVKTLVHEQNSVLGKVNETAFKYLNATLALSLPLKYNDKIKADNKRIFLTGLPIRDVFYNHNQKENRNGEKGREKAKHKNEINLLVLGGSLGAEVFSTILPQTLSKLDNDIKSKIKIRQQCRKELLEQTSNLYKNSGFNEVELLPFIDDIASYMDWSDIIISRSGASTIFEIMAKKKPSILVPYPHATENHQYYNAKFLEEQKTAIIIDETNLKDSLVLLEIFKKSEIIENMQKQYAKTNKDNQFIALDLLVSNVLN